MPKMRAIQGQCPLLKKSANLPAGVLRLAQESPLCLEHDPLIAVYMPRREVVPAQVSAEGWECIAESGLDVADGACGALRRMASGLVNASSIGLKSDEQGGRYRMWHQQHLSWCRQLYSCGRTGCPC